MINCRGVYFKKKIVGVEGKFCQYKILRISTKYYNYTSIETRAFTQVYYFYSIFKFVILLI
jgi:hypothetical protein